MEEGNAFSKTPPLNEAVISEAPGSPDVRPAAADVLPTEGLIRVVATEVPMHCALFEK